MIPIWRILRVALLPPILMASGHQLEITIEPRFNRAPLAFDTLALTSGSGQRLAITRCDFLLSGLALQREDGAWIGPMDWAGYVSLRDGKTRFVLASVPGGRFTGIRFSIGVPPAVNHSDPAKYPPGHALNPLVNGLHWGWQGNYVFAALEGRWRTDDGTLSGFSFHLARDENLMDVTLPLALTFRTDTSMKIRFDLDRAFAGLRITSATETTHSRQGDELATQLRDAMTTAFSVGDIVHLTSRQEVVKKGRALIGSLATPYRFTYPATFPQPSLPADNPLTNEGVALGEKLFADSRLSGNQSQSCLSCHQPEKSFTDGRTVARGSLGAPGRRNAMPLVNLAWKSSYFWDGRVATVREQALLPIQDPVEMHATLPAVVERIAADPQYPTLFDRAFGSSKVDADRIARALEQFVLTRVSGNSRFDRAQRGEATLTAEEQRGAQLFNTEYDPRRGQYGADCFHCHGGALFQSVPFANNGLDVVSTDSGRAQITGSDADAGKFAIPTLRNIELTAPYMHDGRFATLAEVVEHYDHGVKPSPTLDPNLAKHPKEGLQLRPEDKRAIVAFLRTLTDPGFSAPD